MTLIKSLNNLAGLHDKQRGSTLSLWLAEKYTMKKPHTKHVTHVTVSGDHNDNNTERLNGEMRDEDYGTNYEN